MKNEYNDERRITTREQKLKSKVEEPRKGEGRTEGRSNSNEKKAKKSKAR